MYNTHNDLCFRGRVCLENDTTLCIDELDQSHDCLAADMSCWSSWQQWSTCLHDDRQCGHSGQRQRVRYANCTSVPHLVDECPDM